MSKKVEERAQSVDADLEAAGGAFEAELKRYELLARELTGMSIKSQKNLHRARLALQESQDCEQRLSICLQSLLRAMESARIRQQACSELTVAAAHKIEERAGELTGLLERFASLGGRASEVNEPLVEIMKDEANAKDPVILGKAFDELVERMGTIADEADSLARDASEKEWTDIAREAEAVKQQVQAARNKVLLGQRRVAARGGLS